MSPLGASSSTPSTRSRPTSTRWLLRLKVIGASKSMIFALSAAVYQQSQLPARVRESVRMRIAQINDCPI